MTKGESVEGMKYLDTGFSDITKKQARDIAKFFRDSTKIPDTLFEDLYE
jgi:hypothetical protein